jgi:hypothetical protein
MMLMVYRLLYLRFILHCATHSPSYSKKYHDNIIMCLTLYVYFTDFVQLSTDTRQNMNTDYFINEHTNGARSSLILYICVGFILSKMIQMHVASKNV